MFKVLWPISSGCLHSIAYILLHAFREKHLKYTEFAKAQFNTIQRKLIKVAARVRQLATRIKVHLPSSFPFKHEYQKIYHSCFAVVLITLKRFDLMDCFESSRASYAQFYQKRSVFSSNGCFRILSQYKLRIYLL